MSSPNNFTTPDALATTHKPDTYDTNMTNASPATPGTVQTPHSTTNNNTPTLLSSARRKTSRRELIMASPHPANHLSTPAQNMSPRGVTNTQDTGLTPRRRSELSPSEQQQQQQRAFAEIAALSSPRTGLSTASRATATAGPSPLPRLGGTLVLGEGQRGAPPLEWRQRAFEESRNLPLYQPPLSQQQQQQQQLVGGGMRSLAPRQTVPQQQFSDPRSPFPRPPAPQQQLSDPRSPAPRQSAPQQQSSDVRNLTPRQPAPQQHLNNPRHPTPTINIATLSQQLAAQGKPPLTPRSIAGINKVLQGFENITKHMLEEEGMHPQHVAWTWEVIRRRGGPGAVIDWEEEARKRNEMIERRRVERERMMRVEGERERDRLWRASLEREGKGKGKEDGVGGGEGLGGAKGGRFG